MDHPSTPLQWTPFANRATSELRKFPHFTPQQILQKLFGKTMKIAHHNNVTEKEALTRLLSNYRDSPHPSTGVTPNDMFFFSTSPTIRVSSKEHTRPMRSSRKHGIVMRQQNNIDNTLSILVSTVHHLISRKGILSSSGTLTRSLNMTHTSSIPLQQSHKSTTIAGV